MTKPAIDFEAVAGHLANPTGTDGIKVARKMNESNGDMTRYAVDLLACADGEQVLEIGPGNGLFAAYVLDKGTAIHYTGVDISPTMVEEARRLNQHHISSGKAAFEQTDGVILPFPDHAFSKIFTANTLYFWKNPPQQLAEIRRVLKKGGIFCLAIADKSFMESLPFTAYGFTLYGAEGVQELLIDSGFKLVDTVVRKHSTHSAAGMEVLRDEIFVLAK